MIRRREEKEEGRKEIVDNFIATLFDSCIEKSQRNSNITYSLSCLLSLLTSPPPLPLFTTTKNGQKCEFIEGFHFPR